MRRYFTDHETRLLEQQYPLHGAKHCAALLDRSVAAIHRRASKLKIRVPHDKVVALRKLGCVRPNDYYDVNPEHFYDIKLPEVAYFLGYFWADGHLKIRPVKEGNQYVFSFTILYSDYLCIRSTLNRIGKWHVYIKEANAKKKRLNRAANVQTGNMPLVVYLSKHDFQIKSYVSPTKILSIIPDSLKHYFWRGYMDGDGSWHVGKSSSAQIAGTLNQDWLDAETILSTLGVVYRIDRRSTDKGGGSCVVLGSCKDMYLWGKYLYSEYERDQIGLPRKYQRWKQVEEKYIHLEKIRNFVPDEDKKHLNDITKLLGLVQKYSGIITRGKILQHFGVDKWVLSKEAKRLREEGKIRVNTERWPNPYEVL